MTCPHQQPLSPLAIRCDLIAMQLAGPANPNYPCDRCQSEWVSGQPPTAETLTPTLAALVELQKPIEPPWDISQPSRGIGDTAAKLLHAIGIRKRRGCGCSRRQHWLNKWMPYH